MLASKLAIAAAALLVAAGLVLGGALLMLWGGYLLLAPLLGPGVAALVIGGTPVAMLLVASAVLVARAHARRRPLRASLPSDLPGDLLGQGAAWARQHPLETVSLGFLAGTMLGVSADVRDGVGAALAGAVRSMGGEERR